jgi:phosphatidylglycerophosphate synthase
VRLQPKFGYPVNTGNVMAISGMSGFTIMLLFNEYSSVLVPILLLIALICLLMLCVSYCIQCNLWLKEPSVEQEQSDDFDDLQTVEQVA